MSIRIDKKGYVDKSEFYNLAVDKFKNSVLNGFVPHDGVKYQVDGSPESWANFAMRVATVESGFNTNSVLSSDPGGSYGLFQWGLHYGITNNNWRDPEAQLNAFINYAKIWTVQGGGYINPPKGAEAKRYSGYGGFAAAFSTVRDNKVNSKYAYSVADNIPKHTVVKKEEVITPLVVEEKKKSIVSEVVENVTASIKKTVQNVVKPKPKPKAKSKPKSSDDSVGEMIRKKMLGEL